jgi:hypothetical protein
MVVAVIALGVALSAGAYAAIKVPKASVGTKQLKNGAVTPPKVSASTLDQLKGEPGQTGLTGPTGPPGPGAKLLVTEPVASASNGYVQLGQAGPFTLHTRCRISAGTVDAHLVATGPAHTSDATYVQRASSSPTSTIPDSDIETAATTIASPKTVGNSGAPAGGNSQNTWISTLMQADSSVLIQAWVRAETAGGPNTDSCRFAAIVTPLE